MAEGEIPLDVNSVRVGGITIDQTRVTAFRVGDGVRIGLPTKIALAWTEYPAPRPLLSNIRCTIHLVRPKQDPLELGVASDTRHYSPPKSGSRDMVGDLQWPVSLGTLAIVERIRNGKPPQFRVDLSASVCDLLPEGGGWHEIRTAPTAVTGTTHVTFSSEVWTGMRRIAGISQHVLLDIPFPPALPPGWEQVWKHVMDTIASFDEGGHTAWKNCVTSVREALTEWERIEPLDPGPAASQQRNLQQRVDQLRSNLRQLAHLGPHGHAENWTRDDAILALATLSGLLARRHP